MEDLFDGTVSWQTVPKSNQIKLFLLFEAPKPERPSGQIRECTQEPEPQVSQDTISESISIKQEKVSYTQLMNDVSLPNS
jgi:hypothetical protein